MGIRKVEEVRTIQWYIFELEESDGTKFEEWYTFDQLMELYAEVGELWYDCNACSKREGLSPCRRPMKMDYNIIRKIVVDHIKSKDNDNCQYTDKWEIEMPIKGD